MPQYSFTPFPIINTERLVLQALSPADREAIFFMRSDDAVNQYIGRPRCADMADADAFIAKIAQRIATGGSVYWTINRNGTGFIGTICLWNFSEDGQMAELGYELHPAHQKQGYMQEAIAAVLGYAFTQLRFTTVEAYTHKDNAASIRLLTKNGFVYDPNKTDPDYPHNAIYAITKEDFNKNIAHATLP